MTNTPNPEALSASERKAVLLLHAMSEADRNWLLGQLGSGPSSRILEGLEEVERLGIPRDPQLARQAINAMPKPSQPDHQCVKQASAAQLADILVDEAPETIGLLLRIEAWSWSDELLRLLPPRVQMHLRQHTGTPLPCPPKVAEHLLRELAARLTQQHSLPTAVVAERPTPAARGWFGKRRPT